MELDWEAGAEVTLLQIDGWPAATRLDRSGEDAVAVTSWDEGEDFNVYESFLTAVTVRNFPTLETAELDALIEPLWDGANQVSANLDGIAGDELTVFTQSESSLIVLGRNRGGDIVSVLIWTDWYQWRTLGLEGNPPPAVLEREAQLRACVAGDRPQDLDGHCPWSDD